MIMDKFAPIIGALKLADDLDEEFCQGRISNHNGRKAAQMIRLLIDAAHRTKDLTDVEYLQDAVTKALKKRSI